ncbi:hypothetical protein [Pararcticibacter amylolyticus]|uniref:Uncharacterized protein n=1 Tax=Pararcticibacter amylolyticus TaxID=2173175 RepID=A0A2U2PK70_9SPHI|nr:hypothetical protein [Pararcticibacter amylolyticus]PWG81805.1 hypothetical protein DDR33_05440 [Pararcticibacter amylolyticus]
MSTREILDNLEKNAQAKHLLYLDAGQALVRQEGVVSKADMDKFDQAKEAWLSANNAYRSFLLSLGKDRKVS